MKEKKKGFFTGLASEFGLKPKKKQSNYELGQQTAKKLKKIGSVLGTRFVSAAEYQKEQNKSLKDQMRR